MTIRRKLILSVCLPLLLLYAAVLAWDYSRSKDQAMLQAQQLVAERAGNAASRLNERLLAVQQAVDAAASVLTNRQTVTQPHMRSVLIAAMRPTTWIDSAWIAFAPDAGRGPGVGRIPSVRRDGIRSGSPDGSGPAGRPFFPDAELTLTRPPTDQAWYTEVQAAHRGMWFDPGTFAEPDPDAVAIYAAPFYRADGGFAGVVCGTVRVEDLQHLRHEPGLMRPRQRMTPARSTADPSTRPTPLDVTDGGYVLLDRRRHMLSHPASFQVTRPPPPLADHPHLVELRDAIDRASAGHGTVLNLTGLDTFLSGFREGETYMMAIEPVRATGWVFMTAVPESQLLGPVNRRLIQRGLVLVLSVFVLGGVVMVLITRFCRPIENMAGRVDQLAHGQLDIEPIPVRSNDEIGKLARGFNAMTGELRRHIEALTEESAARERVEGELRIARQIQTDLLPRTFPPFPERKEFDLHAINIPARHIAGDFFDFFFASPDVLTIVIADVSGKGIPAAMMMAVTRTIIRNLASTGASPRDIVDRANRTLVEDTAPGVFVTMILGEYRPLTGEFTFVNAGHPPAIGFGPGIEPILQCPPTAPLLGVTDVGDLGVIEQKTIQLDVGQGLLFYTDGVTDARLQAGGELFGEDRLIASVRRRCEGRCADLCDGIVRDVMRYQENVAADDVTMIALQRLS